MNRRHALRTLAALPALSLAGRAWAGAPDFSYMSLNGLHHLTLTVTGIPEELSAYGVTREAFETHCRDQLAPAGLALVAMDDALRRQGAGLLQIQFFSNRDAHGFYTFAVKVQVRAKLPLGNPAGGFVSTVVWADEDKGLMQFNEFAKPLAALDNVLARLAADYRTQNPPAP